MNENTPKDLYLARKRIKAAEEHLDTAADGEHAEGNILHACANLAQAIKDLAFAIERIDVSVKALGKEQRP